MKLLYKAIRKRPIKNTKKSPGIEFALFNCAGKMRMDSLGCLNSSLFNFISILQRTRKNKILWRTYAYS